MIEVKFFSRMGSIRKNIKNLILKLQFWDRFLDVEIWKKLPYYALER